jgi:hypothetical protein
MSTEHKKKRQKTSKETSKETAKKEEKGGSLAYDIRDALQEAAKPNSLQGLALDTLSYMLQDLVLVDIEHLQQTSHYFQDILKLDKLLVPFYPSKLLLDRSTLPFIGRKWLDLFTRAGRSVTSLQVKFWEKSLSLRVGVDNLLAKFPSLEKIRVDTCRFFPTDSGFDRTQPSTLEQFDLFLLRHPNVRQIEMYEHGSGNTYNTLAHFIFQRHLDLWKERKDVPLEALVFDSVTFGVYYNHREVDTWPIAALFACLKTLDAPRRPKKVTIPFCWPSPQNATLLAETLPFLSSLRMSCAIGSSPTPGQNKHQMVEEFCRLLPSTLTDLQLIFNEERVDYRVTRQTSSFSRCFGHLPKLKRLGIWGQTFEIDDHKFLASLDIHQLHVWFDQDKPLDLDHLEKVWLNLEEIHLHPFIGDPLKFLEGHPKMIAPLRRCMTKRIDTGPQLFGHRPAEGHTHFAQPLLTPFHVNEHLKHLYVDVSKWPDLSKNLRGASGLVSLALENVVPDTFEYKSLPKQLTFLRLVTEQKLGWFDKHLVAIGDACPNLDILSLDTPSINEKSWIGPSWIKEFVLETCPSIRFVYLGQVHGSFEWEWEDMVQLEEIVKQRFTFGLYPDLAIISPTKGIRDDSWFGSCYQTAGVRRWVYSDWMRQYEQQCIRQASFIPKLPMASHFLSSVFFNDHRLNYFLLQP